MSSLDEIIDQRVGEVNSEGFDLTFSEIVNLHYAKELIIQPEYQRLFRWENERRSRLIESILLKLPIPQIFVIENSSGVLELIDGLQRISSVIQFINHPALNLEQLVLQGCDLIPELNGKTFTDLSTVLQLRIKRASIRTIVIKRQSKSFIRYEMFKRLNTGGLPLSHQEVRSCSLGMLGEDGIKFYSFLRKQASMTAFQNCTETLPQVDREQKGDEELVLRFFAVKNAMSLFKGSVGDWLDLYMEEILLKEINFDYEVEEENFSRLFTYLDLVLGAGAFVRYKDNRPIGALAPAYYEAVTVGIFNVLDKIRSVPIDSVKQKIISTLQSDAFRSYLGAGANKLDKLRGRILTIENALLELIGS